MVVSTIWGMSVVDLIVAWEPGRVAEASPQSEAASPPILYALEM
jgi:hypothetical protein